MFLSNRHPWWFRMAVVAGAAGLFLLGYQWGNQVQRGQETLPEIAGVLVRPPGSVPGFRLEDPHGRVFDARSLADGWTLLAFGDLAGAAGQLAVQRLVDLYNRVADQDDLHGALRLVLVTPDPPEALAAGPAADYARLSPALWVLGGPAGERARLGAALGAGAAAAGSLWLFAPGGSLVAVFTGAADPARTAADLRALHDHLDLLLPEGT